MFESEIKHIRNFFTLPRNREERTQAFVFSFKSIGLSVVLAVLSALTTMGFLSFIASIIFLILAFGLYQRDPNNLPIIIIMCTIGLVLLFSIFSVFSVIGGLVLRFISWIFVTIGVIRISTTIYSILVEKEN